jgi:hypothetical protein
MNMKKTTSALIFTLLCVVLFLAACDMEYTEDSVDTFNKTLRGTWVSLSRNRPYSNGKVVISNRTISIDYPGYFFPESLRPFSELPPQTPLKGYSEKTGDVSPYSGHMGIIYINIPGKEEPMYVDYKYYIANGWRRLEISYADWKDTFQRQEDVSQ